MALAIIFSIFTFLLIWLYFWRKKWDQNFIHDLILSDFGLEYLNGVPT